MWKYLIKGTPKIIKSGYEFKIENSFDKRKEESERIRIKYPNKIPIILERSGTANIPKTKKQKHLVPENLTIGQFLLMIRKEIKLNSCDAMFLFVDYKYIPSSNEIFGEIYSKYVDKDGFLYIIYSEEQTYGY